MNIRCITARESLTQSLLKSTSAILGVSGPDDGELSGGPKMVHAVVAENLLTWGNPIGGIGKIEVAITARHEIIG